jgi:mono/diheme cytochrome c family protein
VSVPGSTWGWWGEELPGGLIEFQVRNGLGVMPAFSEEQIGDAELDALVAYLMALKRKDIRPHLRQVGRTP